MHSLVNSYKRILAVSIETDCQSLPFLHSLSVFIVFGQTPSTALRRSSTNWLTLMNLLRESQAFKSIRSDRSCPFFNCVSAAPAASSEAAPAAAAEEKPAEEEKEESDDDMGFGMSA